MGNTYINSIGSASPIVADTAGDTWIFRDGATLDVDGTAIEAMSDADNRTFMIGSTIDADIGIAIGQLDYQEFSVGNSVFIAGSAELTVSDTGVAFHANMITVVNNGKISGDRGIFGHTFSGTIENAGIIDAGTTAIEVHGDSTRTFNSGRLTSDGGPTVSLQGTQSFFSNTGSIESKGEDFAAVEIGSIGGDSFVIVNDGLVSASKVAFQGGAGSEFLRNYGTIKGDVLLGDGMDTFEGIEGRVRGSVSGGDESDQYIIHGKGMKLVENADEGSDDTVSSYISYKLGNNFERLALQGSKALNGTGNNLDNWITGNEGTNRLAGGAGTDTLYGWSGKDFVSGGSGADTFVFAASSDLDTVTDFEAGLDKIQVLNLGVTDFATLKPMLDQKGDDVVVDFGGGDRLVILDVKASALSESDFLFS